MGSRTVVVVQRHAGRGAAWAEALRADGYHVIRSDAIDEGVLAAAQFGAAVIVAEVASTVELDALLGCQHREPRPAMVVITPTTAPLTVRRTCAIAVHVARPSAPRLVASLRELMAGIDDDHGPRPSDAMLPFRLPAQRVTKWRRWLPSPAVPQRVIASEASEARRLRSL